MDPLRIRGRSIRYQSTDIEEFTVIGYPSTPILQQGQIFDLHRV